MLVLNREQNKSVTLVLPDGQLLTVAILQRGKDGIKIGIDTDDDIKVVRTKINNKANAIFQAA